MKTIYKKLVRDKIPEIIEQSGKKANYRVLDQEEFREALKAKLLEEVNEFLQAKTTEEMIDEIGDIQTVLSSILVEFDYDYNEYKLKTIKKAKEKGLFIERYFLESVEE